MILNRIIFSIILFLGFTCKVNGQDILVGKVNESQLVKIVDSIDLWREAKKQKWIEGLNSLPDSLKRQILIAGERANEYTWPSLKAMVYLDFKYNGNRSNYETIMHERRRTLTSLVKAELLEKKGRFIPQIVNGIWLVLEESSWVYPAHLSVQKLGIGLPNIEDDYIDLGDGRVSAEVAMIYFLMNKDFDKVSKQINVRIRHELRRRITLPYLERDDFWWMGFKATFVNNWNIWINANVLKTFLLIEQDKEYLKKGITKVLRSADKFVNSYPKDGACDEGPSYWMHAGGELGILVKWLKDASGGSVDFSNVDKIKKIGQYIINTNVSKNRYINFADANAIEKVDPVKVWNYYDIFVDQNFAKFANWLKQDVNISNYGLVELLEYALVAELGKDFSSDFKQSNFVYYPSLGQVIIRSSNQPNNKLLFLAIGSHNAVSHNHNDVGSFMLYLNDYPVLIDAGVGTYNA